MNITDNNFYIYSEDLDSQTLLTLIKNEDLDQENLSIELAPESEGVRSGTAVIVAAIISAKSAIIVACITGLINSLIKVFEKYQDARENRKVRDHEMKLKNLDLGEKKLELENRLISIKGKNGREIQIPINCSEEEKRRYINLVAELESSEGIDRIIIEKP